MRLDKLIDLDTAIELSNKRISLTPVEGFYALGEEVEFKPYIDNFGNCIEAKIRIKRGTILKHKTPYTKKAVPIYSLHTVQDYLRERYGIDIGIYRSFAFDNSYYYVIYKDNDVDNSIQQESLPNRAYYTTLGMAIQKALTYIIN